MEIPRVVAPLLLLCLTVSNAAGQHTVGEIGRSLEASRGEIVRVRTAGRGEFQGLLISVSEDRVEIQNGEGQIISVAADQIIEVLVIDPTRRRDTYFQDAAANKLILMPVGFPMDGGELHVADQEIVAVSASYGVTDNFSLWGGLSIPGAILNARYGVAIGEKVGMSAGSFVGVAFIDPGALVLLPYVITSVGSPNQNLTLGVGGVFYSWDPKVEFYTVGGAAAIAGKIVLSQTASIITENWIMVLQSHERGGWTSDRPVVAVFPAVAFRIAGSRFSWDIGITMPFSFDDRYDYEYDEATDTETETYLGYGFGWLLYEPIPIPIVEFTYRVR